jgi:hypothetical protein
MAISFSLVPEELGLRDPLLVGAFTGWPDASLGASGAVRFLVEALRAAPLATWDGDEYYDFTELRPLSRVVPPRDRALIWHQGEFWVAREVPFSGRGDGGEGTVGSTSEPSSRSVILFLAPEPKLRWRSYSRELAAFAQRCGVTQVLFFGAAYADVPHTRPPIVTGWATESRLRTRLEAIRVPFSAYQGPSSMQSAAIEACREIGMACVSLFSNGPSYLTVPNANLSLALLRRLAGTFGLALDLKLLEEAAQALTNQVNAAMEERSDDEFREHVRRLEARFDERASPLAPGQLQREVEREAEGEAEGADAGGPLNVDPQDVVRELEDFLRRRSQSQRGQEDQTPEPDDAREQNAPNDRLDDAPNEGDDSAGPPDRSGQGPRP